MQRQWKRLSDGSFFETHNPYDTGEPLPEVLSDRRIASRCWPDGKRYDCVVLSFDHDGGTAADVVAERLTYLSLADSDTTDTGYSCSASELKPFGILYHETIASDAGDPLLENMQTDRPPYETGWSGSFVDKFMKDNGVTGGGRFFNCLGLRKLLDDGGPATLGTTAATRDQFL